jgi:hypothetical protein
MDTFSRNSNGKYQVFFSYKDQGRCRVRDEEHIAILEHIARYSENEPRQAIEGSGPGGAIPFSVVLPAALCDDET